MENWFSAALIRWYRQNKRDLPWRHEKDPYKIWLSEIILQQTQVAQGLSYYLKFTQKYPDIKSLANAKEDAILKMWQGLGYYSRARNLHAAAKTVHEIYSGVFPTSYAAIKELKGVGDYTAAAVASFAYDLPHAVVDGNVYRVLSRVFGIENPIDTSAGKKEFQDLANALLNKKNSGLHNQAIMEFGSQYCKPQNPDCENCIFKEKCYAFKTTRIKELPVKSKKIKIKNRYFNYLVVKDKEGDYLINKRQKKDIWQGLYEFKLIETKAEVQSEVFLDSKEVKKICGSEFGLKYISKGYKHLLTHQHLYAKFYVLNLKRAFKQAESKSSFKNLSGFAFPRLIEKFLNDCDLKEIV